MKSCVFIFLIALGLPASASAQAAPTRQAGSLIPSKPKPVDDAAKAARFAKSVANCTFNRLGAENIHRILDSSDPITVDFDQAKIDRIRLENALEGCMSSRFDDFDTNVRISKIGMSYTPNRLRAMFLEEAYLARFPEAITLPEGATEMTARPYVSQGEALVSAKGLGNFADCLVFRSASEADRLLRSEPGSSEEMNIARELAPTLSACLIDGQTITFTPASIRALAADGLWARAAYGSFAG